MSRGGDRLEPRVAPPHDRRRRLEHGAAVDRTSEDRALQRLDADGDDLDVGARHFVRLEEPVVQRDRRHAAGRERADLGRPALRLAEGGERRGGIVAGFGKRVGQSRRGEEGRAAGAGGADDMHVEPFRPGDRNRRDADRQHVERARRNRLDGGGAGIEFGEADVDARFTRPAGAVEHVERGGADDGDVADAQREGALRAHRRGGKRGGGEEEGAAGEHPT
ncbi:MAG: hypothetical protein QOG66_852 [Methylobacteriaceae bacterium]|jgi:hypothetical protein|nr:hypothetical protein [Methylobacteriaceae bacterium]